MVAGISTCSPDPRRYRALFPFAPNYLRLPSGLLMHYVDQGSGAPVVMVHGNPTWSFFYRRLITGLSPKFRTLAVDHIGCGLSDKPGADQYDFTLASRVGDFARFMDKVLPDEKVTLVVHDWGGMIAMAWAVDHPRRVSRLVVFNTAAFPLPKGKSMPFALWAVKHLTPLAKPAVLGLNLFSGGAVHLAAATRLAAPVKSGLTAPYHRPKTRLATLRFVQDIPVVPGDPGFDLVKRTGQRLGRLSHLPVLLVWGMKDWVFDADYLAKWRRHFPNARTHPLKDAGHYLLEDQPDRVLALVRTFLFSHPV